MSEIASVSVCKVSAPRGLLSNVGHKRSNGEKRVNRKRIPIHALGKMGSAEGGKEAFVRIGWLEVPENFRIQGQW